MLLVDATRRRVTQLPLLAGTLAAILAIALAVSSRKAADRTVALIALAVLGVYAITEMRRVSRDDDTISVRSLLLAARFPAAGCRVLVRQRGLWNATRIDIELRPPRGWPVKLASYPPLGQGRPRHAAERVAEALGVQGPDLPSTR
jgi:hypothetical protein